MVGNTHSVRFVSLFQILLALINSGAIQADQVAVVYPRIIEVFATADVPVIGETALNRQPEYQALELHIYELDVIQRFETNLSRDLLANPEQSRRMALQAIQQMDDASREKMQRAVMGLAKAMQYGIDRYPAIVLDGEVAIYGVTDIPEAIHRYVQWREDR